MSSDLDLKMEQAKKKPVAVAASPVPSDEKVLAQLNCAKKMIKTYEIELQDLKAQVESKTGYDKVVEIEAKYGQMMKEQEELQKQAKELKKQVKVSGKRLTKHSERVENGIPQIEVTPPFLTSTIGKGYAQNPQQGSRINRRL